MPYIVHNHSKLHYRVYGTGKKVLLAFHGYGQESAFYSCMEPALGQEYTLYSFDLFFHGNSSLQKKHIPLTKNLLTQFFRHFLEKHQINSFSVMAFSMGGKFALTLTEFFADKMERLFLIAPDGIHTNFWYNIATYPGWLQGLFKRTVVKPRFFFNMLQVLHNYKLANKSLLRFARFQMETKPKRLRDYRSWVGFKDLSFDIRKIVKILNKNKVHVTIFLGEFDQIISRKQVEIFESSLNNSHLILLRSGHSYLLQDVATYIRRNGHILSKRMVQ